MQRVPLFAAACAGLLLLSGCGAAAVATNHSTLAPVALSTPSTPAPSASAQPAPTPAATPTTTPTPPAPVPPAPPPVAPQVVPLPPAPVPTTFAITPLTAGGAGGSVMVTLSGGVARYHLTVTGLVPGSVHTIHDHLGSCTRAASTMHLAVLTTQAADGGGSIIADVTVPARDAGTGRIVIVYSSASPAVVTGCADL
jgi:hypothetical protein